MENILKGLEAGERGKRVINIQIFDVDPNTGANRKAVGLPIYAIGKQYSTKEEIRNFIKKLINEKKEV